MLSLKPSVCACLRCKQMCVTSPCFGTPVEIMALIDAGYKDHLMSTAWLDIEWSGFWPLIAPKQTQSGCTFRTTDGLCKLHSLNLKPLEGRLAHHTNRDEERLRRSVCFTWVNQTGLNLLKSFNADTEMLEQLSALIAAYSAQKRSIHLMPPSSI